MLYHCYPLLNYAFTSLGISFPPRCKPYLDDALPLRRVAKQRISMVDRRISFAMPCLTLLFLCLAKRGWALPLPYFSTLCCSFALLIYASPRKAFAALHVPKQNSAGPMCSSWPCGAPPLRCYAWPYPAFPLLRAAQPRRTWLRLCSSYRRNALPLRSASDHC